MLETIIPETLIPEEIPWLKSHRKFDRNCRDVPRVQILSTEHGAKASNWYCKTNTCENCGPYNLERYYRHFCQIYANCESIYSIKLDSEVPDRIRKFITRHSGFYVSVFTGNGELYLFTQIEYAPRKKRGVSQPYVSREINYKTLQRFIRRALWSGGEGYSSSQNISLNSSKPKNPSAEPVKWGLLYTTMEGFRTRISAYSDFEFKGWGDHTTVKVSGGTSGHEVHKRLEREMDREFNLWLQAQMNKTHIVT